MTPGTIIIALALAVIVFFIVRGLVNDKKKGKSTCGGSCGHGCGGCDMNGSCHKH